MADLIRAQRGETYAGYSDLTILACPTCGVLYAIPERMRAQAEEWGGRKQVWYCPNGHEMGYDGSSRAEELEAKLERERQRSTRLLADRDQTEAALRAQKGRATRFRNDRDRERRRTAAGVCPCCNRTFKQLARHMASQHPGFPPPEREAPDA